MGEPRATVLGDSPNHMLYLPGAEGGAVGVCAPAASPEVLGCVRCWKETDAAFCEECGAEVWLLEGEVWRYMVGVDRAVRRYVKGES